MDRISNCKAVSSCAIFRVCDEFERVVTKLNLDRKYIELSLTNLAEAIFHFEKDIEFLKSRRGIEFEMKLSKYAGSLLYRLAHHNVVALPGYGHDKPYLSARFYIILNSVIEVYFNSSEKVKDFRHNSIQERDKRFYKELYYLLYMRHTNQENLSLILEAFYNHHD